VSFEKASIISMSSIGVEIHTKRRGAGDNQLNGFFKIDWKVEWHFRAIWSQGMRRLWRYAFARSKRWTVFEFARSGPSPASAAWATELVEETPRSTNTTPGPQFAYLVSPRTERRLDAAEMVTFDNECTICCEGLRQNGGSIEDDFMSSGPTVHLSFCHHCFHVRCIKTWMETGGPTCPLCRSDQGKLMKRLGLKLKQ